MKQVNIRVDEEVKEKWESKVQEYNDLNSITELIRFSVEKEISDRDKDENQDLDEIRETLSKLLQVVRQVSNHTEDIKDDTDYLQAYTATSEEIETIIQTNLEELDQND